MKAVPNSKQAARFDYTVALSSAGVLAVLCLALATHAAPLRAADAPAAAAQLTASTTSGSLAQVPGAPGGLDNSLPLQPDTAAAPGSPSGTNSEPDLSQVTVEAPEPRFVAPTRRDRIGRIWAPVFINGKGPFRLAVDSCADTSGITKRVAQALGLSSQSGRHLLLHGGIGTATVPAVRLTTFNVGDLSIGRSEVPIVPDALGGADGILGTSRMGGRRIMIDFRHDLITITRSRKQPAPAGYLTIPFKVIRPELIMVDAQVGGVAAKAIIDTGGQGSIANLALRDAMEKWRLDRNAESNKIEDVTKATMSADSADSPPILIGVPGTEKRINIEGDRLTFANMRIFDHWQLAKEPTVLIGMNTLGQFDVLIIDYERRELQILMRGTWRRRLSD